MTDITELAQSLKNAASKALIEEGLTWFSEEQLSHEDGIALHKADAEFIALANPANVLALVEALEKAQQQMTESENRVRKQNRHICELFDDNTALRQRIAGLEARTVKLPDELSGETLLDNYSDVVYSDDTGVLEYTNIIGCFVKITAPPDKVIRFRWSNEGMHIRLVDRVKTHEHAGIIVDFPKNNKDFIQ